jgi:hypothetical protein
MKVSYSSISILIFALYFPVLGQENVAPGVSKSDWEAIQSLVVSGLNSSYQLMDVVNVDSAVGNRAVADGAITNPYGTLSGCFIFTIRQQDDASPSLHGSLGVYRNGSSVWRSDPGIINATYCTMASISEIRDLNDDGKADIVCAWFSGSAGSRECLWIFSWDGQTGNLMNAVDENDESLLISVSSGFEFVDVNGDNVYEISSEWYANPSDEETNKVIYSWNGVQYGKWNPPQPLPSGFYPRDKVDAVVRTVVKSVGTRFSYSYKLQS